MPSLSTPSCPRCGYDLPGTIASWTHSCPLRGVCSECGTNFDWVLVFNPKFIPIPDHRMPGWAVLVGFAAFAFGLLWLIGWAIGAWGL